MDDLFPLIGARRNDMNRQIEIYLEESEDSFVDDL